MWLGLHDVVEGSSEKEGGIDLNVANKQRTGDEGLLPSQTLVTSPKVVDVSTIPPREWIVVAIREHVSVSSRCDPALS